MILTLRDRNDRIVDLTLLLTGISRAAGPCHSMLLVQVEHRVEVHPLAVGWVVLEVSAEACVARRWRYAGGSSIEIGLVPPEGVLVIDEAPRSIRMNGSNI
jgi:hypothetical protein